MTARGISSALYGWMEAYARDGVDWDWDRIYGDVAAAGFDAVETDPTPAKVAVLDRLGLRVSSSYVGMSLDDPLSEERLEERVLPVARRLAEAGGATLVMNADPTPGVALDPRVVGGNLSLVADRVAPLGLRVALHNHAPEPERFAAEVASVLDHADASVGFCLDTGWAAVAGADPVAFARDHADRMLAFHLRTVDADGVPAVDLTAGTPDVRALLDAVPGFDGWLIAELWHPAPYHADVSFPDANARSVQHLRSLPAG